MRRVCAIIPTAITTAINNHGLITPSVIMTVAVLKAPFVMKIMNTEITKSTTVTSFANRVTILPIGLESKKRILALNTL